MGYDPLTRTVTWVHFARNKSFVATYYVSNTDPVLRKVIGNQPFILPQSLLRFPALAVISNGYPVFGVSN